ncbi:MAG: TetR/AcrR family transcriptional regulator [Acidimicrobiales bacterium]
MTHVDTQPVEAHPPPGKRERNKADKQRRILGAAKELFQEQGFAETTTAQISDKAGIGAGTLYLYFESKEELLIEVFQGDVGQAWHDAFDHLDRSLSLSQQLLQAFGSVSDFHRRDPELARTYFKELLFLSSGTTSSTDDFMRKYYDRLTVLLLEARESGQLRDDVPVAVLSRNMFALWSHVMRRSLASHVPASEMRNKLEASFSVALLGLTPTD